LDAWSAEQLAGRLDDSAVGSASTVDFATPGAVQTAVVELLVAALAAAGMSAYSVMEHLLRLELVLEHLVQPLARKKLHPAKLPKRQARKEGSERSSFLFGFFF